VDIQQGGALKGGEAFKGVEQSCRFAVTVGDQSVAVAALGQCQRQPFQYIGAQGLATPHGVAGVIIQQQSQCGRVFRQAEIGLNDFNLVFRVWHSSPAARS